MWLENIGRTIGDIFGFNRKKPEENRQPVAPRPQPQQSRPAAFNSGVSQFKMQPTQPAHLKPTTVGQPIQSAQDYITRTGHAAPSGSMLSANPADQVDTSKLSDLQVQQALRKRVQRQAGGTPTERAVKSVFIKPAEGAARTIGNAAQGIRDDPIGTAQGIARAPFRAAASLTIANQKGGFTPDTPVRKFFYGDERVPSLEESGRDLANFGGNIAGNTDSSKFGSSLNPAAAMALGVLSAGSDLIPGGGAKKILKPKVSLSKVPTKAVSGFSGHTDKLLGNIGIDTEKGLVKGNALYNNPVSKGYNKGQQAIIETIDKGRDRLTSKIQKGIDSENKLTAGVSRLPQVAFKNFGRSDSDRQILTARSSKMQSAGNVAKLVQKDLDDAIQATGNPEATNRRIYQVLETPEFLGKVYKDPTKLSVNDLTPAERAVMGKLVASNKVRNDINLETGIITPEQHAQFADGFHSPRIYDFDSLGTPQFAGKLLDSKASIKRKDITKIDDAITDATLKSPTLASSVRLETALRNKANLEALDELAGAGLIRKDAPNKNFVQLEGKQFGQWDGQFIDKQIKSQLDGTDYFNSSIGQKTGDLVGAYQDSVLGKADRLQKKIKTVYAPATNIGNISSNILAFSGAANVNSATTAFRMSQAAKQLYKHSKKFDPNVYRAEKAGLFSGDTGKQLLGKNEDTLKTLEKKSKNPLKAIESFYGKTDQAAALGIFNELKARGLTDEQAVKRTHKAVQDYNNVGRGINTLADSPVLGKPFARFTPEFLRIMKNNAIYNPVGTAAKIGAVGAGGAALSAAAGETDEERAARENAVGQTKIGGVSLNLPIGDSSVNIARAVGLNFPIEPGGDANSALLRQLSPFADITRTTADGETAIAPNQIVSSMALKPIADQIANRDFMGRQITDPNNRVISELGDGKSQYENPDGSRQSPGVGTEIANRARSLAMSYLPLSSEADALSSAATKQKDYYGKERTMSEAVLRGVGLKTESNTKDVREKRVSTQKFYEGKDKQVKEFLTKNPEIADAYFKFNDSSRDRFTNKKSSTLVTPERWSIVKGETSGKLFNQLKQEALDAKTSDNKPVDPIFLLNDPKRAKELISIRATAPGDNIEKEEILRATTGWYKPFEDAEKKYYDDSRAFYEKLPKSKQPADQNDRVKAYSELAYPAQSKLVEGYYQAKNKDAQAGKNYFKANADALSADFTKYKADKLGYINKKREILGLDPIKPDTFNNVTFGYEDDESKVAKELYFKGKSGSGGGGRGSKPSLGKSVYSYAVSANAGGQFKKATVKAKKTTPIKISKSSVGRPKVSLKKSSV